MAFEIALMVAAAVILYALFVFNSLVSARQKVKNSWAQVDVQLKKRADIVYNLVEIVKSYVRFEKKTLEKITRERTNILNSANQKETISESNALAKTFKAIFAVAENYPNLRANESFLELQKQLIALEEDIAYARMVYNDVVTLYNTAIHSFPANMIAPLFGFHEERHLEASDIERTGVVVKL